MVLCLIANILEFVWFTASAISNEITRTGLKHIAACSSLRFTIEEVN